MKYLLDTNIIVFWLKGRFEIGAKIVEVGAANCFVSEITVAELKFGVACSTPDIMAEKRKRLENFLLHLQIIPISEAIDRFAIEKARLRILGEIIPDFDLLIGSTAVQSGLKMVTNNAKHLSKIENIEIEDWTKHDFNRHL